MIKKPREVKNEGILRDLKKFENESFPEVCATCIETERVLAPVIHPFELNDSIHASNRFRHFGANTQAEFVDAVTFRTNFLSPKWNSRRFISAKRSVIASDINRTLNSPN